MSRIAAFVALTLLVLLCEVPARGKVIEFTYSGSFEYVYPEPDAPIGAPAPGTNWTACLLFDDTAPDLCSPAHCDPSLAVCQGIGVDLAVDGSLLHFEPVWINVADNFAQSIRGGYFYDQFDVAAGPSAELYLALYDPTLAAVHSTALPTIIQLADWPNHDIVFSPPGVYATGPIGCITSRVVPEPASAILSALAVLGLVVTLGRRKGRCALARRDLVVASIALLVSAGPASAAMFNASSAAELIAAIDAAKQNAEPDTIALALSTTFTLSNVNNSTHGATGLPTISANENLTILGNGGIIERSTASGTPLFRLFDVAAEASLALENLTLQGGSTELVSPLGGAIYSAGTLALSNVIVQNNTAMGRAGSNCDIPCGPYTGGPGWNSFGGGIFSAGTLLLENSTVSNNRARGGRGGSGSAGGGRGGNAYGGGLYAAAGTATLNHSIVSGNIAQGGAGGNGGSGPPGGGYGGGLCIGGAQVSLDEFTAAHVAGNVASTNYPNIFGPFNVIPNMNPLPGDYNSDGLVDAADYVVWRNGLGIFYTQADYNVWRAHFGQMAGSGLALPSAESLSAVVPEPATLAVLMLAAPFLFARSF